MFLKRSIKNEINLYSRASLAQNPHILPAAVLMLAIGFCYLQLTA